MNYILSSDYIEHINDVIIFVISGLISSVSMFLYSQKISSEEGFGIFISAFSKVLKDVIFVSIFF